VFFFCFDILIEKVKQKSDLSVEPFLFFLSYRKNQVHSQV